MPSTNPRNFCTQFGKAQMRNVRLNFIEEQRDLSKDPQELLLLLEGNFSSVDVKFREAQEIKYAPTILTGNESIVPEKYDKYYSAIKARVTTYNVKALPINKKVTGLDAAHPYAWKLVLQRNGI